MSNARYSTIRPSTVSPNDVEIYYTFTPDRETAPDLSLNRLEPAPLYLRPYTTEAGGLELFGGLYNLVLPSNIFNQKGVYNIIIRPKQIRTTIVDCGSLSALPNQKGIVLNLTGSVDNSNNQINLNDLVNNLEGYRIEYLNDLNGTLILKENYFTIITSANKAEVVSSNLSNVTQKSTTYRLTDTGNLIFLTVSPNSVNPVKPNTKPFIGEPGQNIILTNTNFNPVSIEIELVDYTENEIGLGIFGNQIRDVNNGLVTYYKDDKTIFNQALVYEIKDEFNNPLFEVKEKKEQIDPSQDFEDITSNLQ